MSYPYSELNPEPYYDAPRQLSTGAKLMIVLAVFLGTLMLCCCGIGGALFYWGQKSFSTDSREIIERTREMTEIDIPDPFVPNVLMDMRVPFSDRRLMMVAVYHHPETASLISLTAFDSSVEPKDRNEMRRVRPDFAIGNSPLERESEQVEMNTRVTTIRGREVTFSITRTHGEDGQQRVIVVGEFPGKFGPCQLEIIANEAILPPDKLDALLNSIR